MSTCKVKKIESSIKLPKNFSDSWSLSVRHLLIFSQECTVQLENLVSLTPSWLSSNFSLLDSWSSCLMNSSKKDTVLVQVSPSSSPPTFANKFSGKVSPQSPLELIKELNSRAPLSLFSTFCWPSQTSFMDSNRPSTDKMLQTWWTYSVLSSSFLLSFISKVSVLSSVSVPERWEVSDNHIQSSCSTLPTSQLFCKLLSFPMFISSPKSWLENSEVTSSSHSSESGKIMTWPDINLQSEDLLITLVHRRVFMTFKETQLTQ